MTILELILLLTLVICLILLVLEKGDKLIVSMTGAGISIAAAALPYWTVNNFPNQTLLPDGINTVLSKIEPSLMFIIIGMTLLVGVTAETGIYELIAIKIIKLSKGNQTRLLLYLSLLSMTFAAFLDAYMAIIIIGTITLVSSNILFKEDDNEAINPKPFLLAEALFANVGGMLTRVASPPNLILGAHFNISFLEFTMAMFPVVFLSAIGTFLLLKFFFKKDLAIKISDTSIAQLMSLDENNVIRDPKLLKRAIFIIFATIVGFFLSSVFDYYGIQIDLGYIALAGGFSAVALVSSEKPDRTLHHIEWSVVFFYAGLLIMVGLVEEANLLEPLVYPIELIFNIDKNLGLASIIIFNFIVSSFLDNIPMAAIMTGVIDGLQSYFGTSIGSVHPMVWAAVIGTNAGGNVTPIASAAGVQVVQILNREKDSTRHISFFDFFKIGFIVALIPVIIGIFYVILIANLFYGW